VLTVTQMLRKKGVVDKFVEFFGPGLDSMSLPDRATIANMAPEYGATMGFFPVDAETLRYMRLTGRSEGSHRAVEAYCKRQGLFRDENTPDPNSPTRSNWTWALSCPALAGPKRPQDRVPLTELKETFQTALTAPVKERGFELSPEAWTEAGWHQRRPKMGTARSSSPRSPPAPTPATRR
jgi:aconitate hydratase